MGLAICALAFVFGAQMSQPKPLTKPEVLSLVVAWPPIASSTMHLIQQRGISFSPTDEYIQMLGRATGGRDTAVLEKTVRGAKVIPSIDGEFSKEAALLQHLERCGELNNTPSPDQDSRGAEAECQAAVSLAPRDPFVLLALGTSMRQQQKLKQATAVYRQAIALDSNLPLGHVLLADALLGQGSEPRNEAMIEGLAALRLDAKNNEAMMLFVMLFGDAGVSDRDISTLRSEISGHPNDPAPHFVLGLAYGDSTQSNHLQKAVTELQQATNLDPSNAWYHYHLGGVLSDSGNKQAARAELEMARKLDPNNDIFRLKE